MRIRICNPAHLYLKGGQHMADHWHFFHILRHIPLANNSQARRVAGT